ncbi:MAG: PKD domain-containing protein, partial [Candidatus Nanohalobium sp.]
GGGAAAFPTPTEDEIIPTSEAGANRTVEIGEEILFNGSSSSNAVNFSWSFGDGETSEGEVVTHSYSEAGEYTVNLTVTSETGNIDSDQAYVTVEQPEEDEENPVDGTEEAQEESTQEPEENQGLTGQFTASGTNIAVAGIILALLTLAYMEYTGKTRVTSKTREIISQILEIR